MTTKRVRLRRQRRRLCELQRWRCHYCSGTMRWHTFAAGVQPPDDAATIEHLDDRFSPERGQHPGELRHVAACYACNQARSRYRQAQQNAMARGGR